MEDKTMMCNYNIVSVYIHMATKLNWHDWPVPIFLLLLDTALLNDLVFSLVGK